METLTLFSSHVQFLRRLVLSVESGYLASTILEVLSGLVGGYRSDHLEINVSEKRLPKHLRGNPEGLVLEDLWNFAPLATHLVFRGCIPPSPQAAVHQVVHSLVLENVSADFTESFSSFPSIRILDLSCGLRGTPPTLDAPQATEDGLVSLSA